MKKKLLCGMLAFLPFFVQAQLQSGQFMMYGSESRYLSGVNSKVYQSRSGYLWICSSNGLIRFDGKRYTIFSADHSNPNSLTDNMVVDVVEDKFNQLWIAGFSQGVTRYNQRTGIFKKYPVLCNDGNPIFGVNKIVNDADQNLWFATAGRGMAKYDFEKDSFYFFYPEPDKAKDGTVRGDNFVTDIVPDYFDKNKLWIGSFHGLFLFDIKQQSFHRFACVSNEPSKDILISDLEMQPNGTLWLGTWGNGLQCFDTRQQKFIPFAHQQFENIVYDLKYVSPSVLYAACLNKGLYKYSIEEKHAEKISPGNYFQSNSIGIDVQRISTCPDAGVFAAGKNYLYQQHQSFTRLNRNVFYKYADSSYFSTTSVIWDKHRQQYWISTFENIYAVSKKLAMQKVYPIHAKWDNGELLLNMLEDASGNIWVQYRTKGLFWYDDDKDEFLPAKGIPLQDSLLKSIKSIVLDTLGNLCFFSSGKLYRYNYASKKITSVDLKWDKTYVGKKSLLGVKLVTAPNNQVWLLSQQGIFIFDETHFIKHIHSTGTGKQDLANRFVMLGDFNKNTHSFWLSSGDGLQVMDVKSHSILSTHFLSQGLPANTLRGIAMDSIGRVWIASAAGVGHFSPLIKIWRNFNRVDGLNDDHVDGNLFTLPGGNIAVPQKGGLALYPDSVFLTKNNCKLRITSILVNNKNYTDTVLPEFVTALKLPYNQNNIIIEYAAMDWVYPLKTNYRYRIEGVKGLDTWLPNEEAKLNLAGLQPGTYKLHLRAINNGGYWSNEVVLPIIIKAPFWQTSWFIALITFLVALIAYSLFKYRIAQLKKLQRMRNNISRDLHDDIGSSLSNIGILNELAKRNLHQNNDKSQEYLNRAAEDIQQISENLGDIVWNINPKFDNINNLFIRMKRYAAEMVEGKNILCKFIFPNDVEIKLTMEKRRDFYLLYKEAVNNMVKHSEAKNASIKISLFDAGLELEVKDDGKGFDRAFLKEGNGLQNMQQRAEQIGGKLQIESNPGSGTIFNFKMSL